MRSQSSKALPKKGASVKGSFKQRAPTKQVKKKTVTSTKKAKTVIVKSGLKSAKKKVIRPGTSVQKKDERSSTSDESSESRPDSDISKSPVSTRSNSPTKKLKSQSKQQKLPTTKLADLLVKKRILKHPNLKDSKQSLSRVSETKKDDEGDEIKYKLNSVLLKRDKTSTVKQKTIAKKSTVNLTTRKNVIQVKTDKANPTDLKAETSIKTSDSKLPEEEKNKNEESQHINETTSDENKTLHADKLEESQHQTSKAHNKSDSNSITKDKALTLTPQRPSKSDSERPPKFFTSSRSPRTVDVDVKSCKTTKANISLSDKFLSLKSSDSKTDDSNKYKTPVDDLPTKEPEIDVYTFTDYKVDSPKSILSDFRNPVNRNVGRVRPIARVKGTVIDKNNLDLDKKKYSPHRPIEEVVKQLKAGKKAEEAKFSTEYDNKICNYDSNIATSSGTVDGRENMVYDADIEDKSRNIVSKSYKMVARKSSIPGQSRVDETCKVANEVLQLKDGAECTVTSITSEKNAVKKTIAATAKKGDVAKNISQKAKKQTSKNKITDDELDQSTFSINTSSNSMVFSSSDEYFSESNEDMEGKESSESEYSNSKKSKNKNNKKKGKRIVDSDKKASTKDLDALSPDSLIDLKDNSILLGEPKPSKRRLKLLSMWTGPKRHRMASLNALAKVHCLYENESRSHMELGLMKTVPPISASPIKNTTTKKKGLKVEKRDSTSESEYEKSVKMTLESSEDDSPPPPSRILRVVPGSRGAGKYWDHKSSTSSSEDSEVDYRKQTTCSEKKKTVSKASCSSKAATCPSKAACSSKTDTDKPPAKMKKTAGVPVKKKRNRNEVVMDLKDMVVQKRMASLNATAILAASYEKRSPKSSKSETTSDSNSEKDETYLKKSKNGVGSGVKSELNRKSEDCKKREERRRRGRQLKAESRSYSKPGHRCHNNRSVFHSP